jgi:hypothetical protein
MIRNFKDSFYFIYQIFFKPITIQEELKKLEPKQALLLGLKVMPASIILIFTFSLLGRIILYYLGIIPFNWIDILTGIAVGIAFGIAWGIAGGIAGGITFGIAVGIT